MCFRKLGFLWGKKWCFIVVTPSQYPGFLFFSFLMPSQSLCFLLHIFPVFSYFVGSDWDVVREEVWVIKAVCFIHLLCLSSSARALSFNLSTGVNFLASLVSTFRDGCCLDCLGKERTPFEDLSGYRAEFHLRYLDNFSYDSHDCISSSE